MESGGSAKGPFIALLEGAAAEVLPLLVLALVLVALIGVLIWAVVRIRSRFRSDDDTAAADESMLLSLAELHRRGDLSDEEYRSIKSRLVQRMEGSGSAEGRR